MYRNENILQWMVERSNGDDEVVSYLKWMFSRYDLHFSEDSRLRNLDEMALYEAESDYDTRKEEIRRWPKQCHACGKKEANGLKFEVCAKCECAYYCSRRCQKFMWKKSHKRYCMKLMQ